MPSLDLVHFLEAQKLRLRLRPGQDLICRGAQVAQPVAELLTNKLRDAGPEAVLEFADLKYHELQRALSRPELMKLSLQVVEAATVVITLPKTREELAPEVATLPTVKACALLRDIRVALGEEAFAFCLKPSVLGLMRSFAEIPKRLEGQPDNLNLLLEGLVLIGDQELNQQIVAEMINEKVHDPALAVELLTTLRQAFPAELAYHLAYAKLFEQHDLTREAAEGYRAALPLIPAGKEQSKIAKALERMEKADQKARTKQPIEIAAKMQRLWRVVQTKPLELVSLVTIHGLAVLTKCLAQSADSRVEKIRKLEQLREAAEEADLTRVANSLGRLSDLQVGNILDDLIHGRSFRGEIELWVEVSELTLAGVASVRMPESLAYLINLLKEDKLEGIEFDQIGRALEAKSKLSSKTDPKMADQIRFIALDYVLYKALAANTINQAELIAMQAIQAAHQGEEAEARALMLAQQALEIDPNCVPALDKIAVLSFCREDYPTAREHGQKIIDLLDEQALTRPEGVRFLYQGKLFSAHHERVLRAAYCHVGFGSLKMFEMSQDVAELVRAEGILTRGIERDAPPIAKNLLARVRICQHRYAEALELARDFIAESPENSVTLFELVSTVWRGLRPGDNPADLLEFCYSTLLNLARNPETCTPELETRLVDQGLFLLEARVDEPAQAILDYFVRPENQGKDSYYYALYALALKELRDGKLVSARLLLLEIVEAQTSQAGMYCQEFQGLSPIRANAYSVMIETYRRSGNPPPDELIAEARQSYPDDPILLNSIAVSLEGAERRTEAVECYRRALTQQPYFLTAHFNLIDCLASGRQRSLEQERAFTQAVEDFAGRVAEMLELTATNPAAVYRLDTKDFFSNLINLYCQTNYEPLLDLLQRVLAAKTAFNLKARFAACLAERAAQHGRKGRIPPQLQALARESAATA